MRRKLIERKTPSVVESVRFPYPAQRLVTRAARKAGKNFSEFVRDAAMRDAKAIIDGEPLARAS